MGGGEAHTAHTAARLTPPGPRWKWQDLGWPGEGNGEDRLDGCSQAWCLASGLGWHQEEAPALAGRMGVGGLPRGGGADLGVSSCTW